MKIHDLTKYINDLLQVQSFKDYSPNGLQVEGKQKVKKIAFAVSATLDSIQQAIDWGADALIVHHGILWNHDGAQIITGPFKKRIQLLIDHDLNLLGYHLPLDAHLELGNASQLALKLQGEHLLPFGEYKGVCVGIKAELKKAVKLPVLIKQLEKICQHSVVASFAASSTKDTVVKSFAIVTGGGADYYKEAFTVGVDLFITGEMSEYHWHGAKELGIHLLAAGHHATERFGVLALAEYIQQKFRLDVKFFDSENPV